MAPIVFGIVCCWLISHLWTWELQPDEGFELAKGVIYRHGLEAGLWNDQPPLYSALLGLVFKVSESIYAARCLSATFCLLLLISMARLAKCACAPRWAMFAVILPFIYPENTLILPSVTLEPAMMAVMMFASMVAVKEGSASWGAVVSGAFVGLALMVKLTAIIFVPGLFMGIVHSRVLQSKMNGAHVSVKDIIRQCILCFAATLLTLVLVKSVTCGSGIYEMLKSHSLASENISLGDSLSFNFAPSLLWSTLPTIVVLCLSAFSLPLVATDSRACLLWVDVVVATTVHMVHRPFWIYYLLHFQVPLCILSVLGVSRLLAWHADAVSTKRLRVILTSFLSLAIAVGLFDGAIVHPVSDSNEIADAIRTTVGKEPITGYCSRPIVLFHAGVVSDPWLAVLAAKRFWSYQIDEAQIRRHIEMEGVPLLVLSKAEQTSEWMSLINKNSYNLISDRNGWLLYYKK